MDRFAARTVAVIGDPVLDCYVYGTTHRISREAPVLIVREDARELRLGGAANTAANLAALGAKASLIGLVGNDDDGGRLIAAARERGIETIEIGRLELGCTVTKTRVLAGGLHTTKQQMLRIDRENDAGHTARDAEQLLAALDRTLPRVEALIVSDYGDGRMTPTYVEAARRARVLGKVVVVDSRHALRAFAGVTAVTPNEPEAEEALGISLRAGDGAATKAAVQLMQELQLEACVLTRGHQGMAIAARGVEPVLIPAHGTHEAVDVTGAGDTVVATFTLALTSGATVSDAARLANAAASIVVQRTGAATCSPSELLETSRELAS